jgi:hypothetical protein
LSPRQSSPPCSEGYRHSSTEAGTWNPPQREDIQHISRNRVSVQHRGDVAVDVRILLSVISMQELTRAIQKNRGLPRRVETELTLEEHNLGDLVCPNSLPKNPALCPFLNPSYGITEEAWTCPRSLIRS